MKVLFRVTRLRCASCDGRGHSPYGGGACFICMGEGKVEVHFARRVAASRMRLQAMFEEAGLHDAARLHRARLDAILSIPKALLADFSEQVPA